MTIAVADNGIGFDQQYAEYIFGLFKRLHTKHSGTGLGLAICRRILERAGGRIWAESTPGTGSTFIFTLPHARHKNSQSDRIGRRKSPVSIANNASVENVLTLKGVHIGDGDHLLAVRAPVRKSPRRRIARRKLLN